MDFARGEGFEGWETKAIGESVYTRVLQELVTSLVDFWSCWVAFEFASTGNLAREVIARI